MHAQAGLRLLSLDHGLHWILEGGKDSGPKQIWPSTVPAPKYSMCSAILLPIQNLELLRLVHFDRKIKQQTQR